MASEPGPGLGAHHAGCPQQRGPWNCLFPSAPATARGLRVNIWEPVPNVQHFRRREVTRPARVAGSWCPCYLPSPAQTQETEHRSLYDHFPSQHLSCSPGPEACAPPPLQSASLAQVFLLCHLGLKRSERILIAGKRSRGKTRSRTQLPSGRHGLGGAHCQGGQAWHWELCQNAHHGHARTRVLGPRTCWCFPGRGTSEGLVYFPMKCDAVSRF